MTLYKCEGFKKECYHDNKCLIRNTFDPNHIWVRNMTLRNLVSIRENIDVMCLRDSKWKKARPI